MSNKSNNEIVKTNKQTIKEPVKNKIETENKTDDTVTEILNDLKIDEAPTESILTNKSQVENKADDTKSILSDIQSGLQDVTKEDIIFNTQTETIKIKPDELITVRSMIRGGFNWRCKKSGIWYRWSNIGHVEHVPYEDLYQMYTNNKHYLTRAFLLIENERVIKQFKLIDIYKDIAVVNRLVGKAADNIDTMADICEQAKRIGMRDFLVERLCQMRNNGTLNNVDVINKAQDILKCEILKSE